MIEARGLTKYYGDFPAIEDVSFTAEPGEVIGFLGPNGAGEDNHHAHHHGLHTPHCRHGHRRRP